MPAVTKSLAEYIGEAIAKNYLIVVGITSYTQAKYQTANLPFGLGKTTLAMELAYLLNGGSVTDGFTRDSVWEKVYAAMAYDPLSLARLLEPGRQRIPCAIWDDVQATAPAAQSVPTAIRKFANFISTERPEVACIFMTMPNVTFISAPLRKLINFEIIVSERGLFEVHKLSYYKDFKRPLQDRMHFDYVNEVAASQPFPPLPRHVQEWYDNWRIERKRMLYPQMMKDLETYVTLRQWDENGEAPMVITSHCVKIGGYKFGALIPAEIGEKIHGQQVEIVIRQKTDKSSSI